MSDDKAPPHGFVSLKSITAGKPDAGAALAEIRNIYFKTSRRTIDSDFAHAVELLKSLPDEETRSRAHVYMEGLAELAREWASKEVRSEKLEVRSKLKSRGSRGSGRSGKVSGKVKK